MLALIFPICCLVLINVGVGMILSAMQVFFNDTLYLYNIFILLLRYLSAVFYDIRGWSPHIQRLMLLNPVYAFIKYFRLIVIENQIPSFEFHMLLMLYTLIALVIGGIVYKKNNKKFAFHL